MSSPTVLRAALLVALFALPSSAAKVVRFLSPTSDTVWFKGGATGLTWDAGTTVFLTPAADGWLGYTFPEGASTPSSNYGFTTRDWSFQVQLSIDFTKGDTAWVFPDPFPDGSPRAVYSRPREKVVMFWNPWRYDAGGRPPRMQLEGGAWNPMTEAPAFAGWWSYRVRGFTDLSLLFSDSARTRTVGAVPVLPTPFVVPEALEQSADTIWLRPSPESTGGLVASASRPAPKVVMVFNPWEGRLPVHRPRISFGGGAPLPMVPSGVCGWHAFEFYERPMEVLFSDDHGGATFGATGLGATKAIDVSGVLASRDTVWIARDSVGGLPKVKPNWSGEKGVCERVLLAATIRDFPSGTVNREFGRGKGCGKGNWNGIKGMVEPFLDAERKPVRSRTDTGYAGIPNSWGGFEFGYRCTYDTLPGLRAEIGDSGISKNWFRTVEGVNAETCRDIPLVMDSLTGDYTYDNQKFLPIDDFTHLPDGRVNPYNNGQAGQDGKSHNFGFCLESHGDFEYRKGQVFDFRGDDDVWFFVDGRLVVDLGGIHGAWRDSVLLDSIRAVKTLVKNANGQVIRTASNQDSMLYVPTDSSLVEGRTYAFDFFFCERNPQGSSMRIRTDMNMRTEAGLQMRDSLLADGSRSWTLWMSKTMGQGCAARAELVRSSADRIRLHGPGMEPPTDLAGGLHYGGISVAADLGSFRIDSAKISGLAPGLWELLVVSAIDSTDVRRVPFRVPYTAEPRFLARTPFVGVVGSSFPADVAAFNEVGPDSSTMAFRLRAVPGLSFFLDSALTRRLPSDTTLFTPAGHRAVRVWVRGDASGTYRLLVGRGPTDSTDRWAGIAFQDKGVRFVDSLGVPLPQPSPLLRDLGDTARVWIEAHDGGVRCAACTDSLVLGSDRPGLRFLSAAGAPVQGVRLSGGRAMVLLVAIAPVDSATISASTPDSGRRAVRSPVSFRLRRLGWTTASGAALPVWPVDTSILVAVGPVGLELRGVDGICLSCAGWVRLAASAPGVQFLDPATGAVVDSVRLAGGRASVSVRGTLEAQAVRLTATADGADPASVGSLAFRVRGPDSAAWFDDDGDGSVDRADVHLAQPWTSSTVLRLAWPDTSAYHAVAPDEIAVSADGLSLRIRLATPRPGTAGAPSQFLGRFQRDRGAVLPFPVADRAGPVPVRARLAWGGVVDTLRIVPSEALALSTGPIPASAIVQLVQRTPLAVGLPREAWIDAASGELVLVYPRGASPLPGDSVRFLADGAVSDVLGNRPVPGGRAVRIQGTERPPRDAVMLDVDGDGRADRVVVRFETPLESAPTFRFGWSDGRGGREDRAASAATRTDSGGLVLEFDVAPFALGATSCPASGCQDLGSMSAMDGSGELLSSGFPIRDGVAPVLTRARVRHAVDEGGLDTLLVDFSETVAEANPAGPWIAWRAAGNPALERPVPDQGRTLAADGRTAVLLVRLDSTFLPGPGDEARLAGRPDGALSDGSGTRSDSVTAWVPFEFGPRPVRIDFRAVPAVRYTDAGQVPSPGESALRILFLDPATGSWVDAQGAAVTDTSLLSGIVFSANAPLAGALHVYDNLGTFVARVEFAPWVSAWSAGVPSRFQDRQGRGLVWIAWNGTDAKGRPVGDGVYVLRLLGRLGSDPEAPTMNRQFRMGRKVRR